MFNISELTRLTDRIVFARYQQGGLSFEVEFAVRDNRLIAHVHPLNQGDYILVAEISFAFNRHGLVEKHGERLLVTGKNSHFHVASPNSQILQPAVSNERRLVWGLTGDRWVILTNNPEAIYSEADCRTLIEENRKTYETTRVRSGGILADAAQAASDAASWNIVWNVRENLPVTTVAREFPAGTGITWGGYIQGGWDAVLQSLQADLQSGPLAEASLLGLLADVTSNGFVPNAGTGWGVTENRSEPRSRHMPHSSFIESTVTVSFLRRHFPFFIVGTNGGRPRGTEITMVCWNGDHNLSIPPVSPISSTKRLRDLLVATNTLECNLLKSRYPT